MRRWLRTAANQPGDDAEVRRAAEEEFAAARAQLRSSGFAADVAPDKAVEDRVVHSSAAAVARLRATERAGEREAAPPRRRRVAWATLAMAATAAVVLGVATPSGTPSAAAATPPLLEFSRLPAVSTLDSAPPAEGVLLDLAAHSAAESGPTGDVVSGYTVVSADWNLATSLDAADPQAAVVPFLSVARVAGDGSMERVERRGEPLTPDGRGAADGVEALLGPSVQVDSFPPGFVDTDLVRRLPRDPAALRVALLRQRGCPEAAPSANAEAGSFGALCVVSAVIGLYREQLVPPDLAAALWLVLAAEPAFHEAGTGRDRVGRDCIAVASEVAVGAEPGARERTERWVLLADPATGAYRGVEQVLVAGSTEGLDAPVVLQFTTLVSAA